LIKIIESTNNAKDLELFVRVAVSNEHAEIDLSKKFGALNSEAARIIKISKTTCKKNWTKFSCWITMHASNFILKRNQ
jgi:ornithine decarboxylase